MAENTQPERDSLIDKALKRPMADPKAPINLQKRPRVHETAIQIFLLACGILSIFTTLGIIGVLGNESLAFFARQLWEDTNRPLLNDIDAEQTVFRTAASGRNLSDGDTIRLNEEILFVETYESNTITIDVTGTSAGFRAFCAGETDINDASRPITDDERAACTENGITPLELRVGTDALAVVVNAENEFVQDVTREELALIFGSAANWSEIRPEWPNQPIMRFIPGTDSGTFDFFTDAIYAGDTDMILSGDPITSEDDEQLARTIRENPFAVGFFGFAYYQDNRDSLKALSIDGVPPAAETVADDSYPLMRPLFIYTDPERLNTREHLAAFVDFYLTNVPDVLDSVGYFPAGQQARNAARSAYLEALGMDVTTDVAGDIELPPVDIGELEGQITISGSSTVAPITQRITADFIDLGFLPQVHVLRGYQNTEAVPHRANTTIEIGDDVELVEFFTNTVWQPAIREFGILPLVYGTLSASFIAMIVALPLGMGAAIYLSEYASPNVRSIVKPILEILAGIPTVVYGYFALTFMTPLLQALLGRDVVQIYNSASAGIVVGILIIPLVSSLSEDALNAVPRSLREASYGLGATKLETTVKVVIPAALSGILAAFIVAVSRAVGETMVVAIAAGAGPQNNIPSLLQQRGPGIIFEPAETMTGHIARISKGDLSYDSIDYNSIFAIGLLLFAITLVLNLINNAIVRRFRETY